MRNKIISIVVLISLLFSMCFYLVSCSGNNPEKVVSLYSVYIKNGDFDKVYDILSKDSLNGMTKEQYVKSFETNSSEDESTQIIINTLVRYFDFKPISSEINGDEAIVKTEVTMPDVSKIFADLLPEILALSFTSDDMEGDMSKIVTKYLNENSLETIKVTKNLRLVQEDGWKLDTSSFDLFDFEGLDSFPEIGTEEQDTGIKIQDKEAESTTESNKDMTQNNINSEVTKIAAHTWEDSIGSIWVHGAVEITNTGDMPIKIGNMQISLYDEDNKIVGTIPMMLPIPKIINPGEVCYAGDSTIIEKDINLKTDITPKANYEFEETSETSQNLEVSNIEGIKGGYGDFSVVGNVTNNSNEIADDIRVIVALFDNNDNLLGVLTSSIDISLNPGDSIAFESSYPTLPNEIGIQAVKFVGKAFNWNFW